MTKSTVYVSEFEMLLINYAARDSEAQVGLIRNLNVVVGLEALKGLTTFLAGDNQLTDVQSTVR